jgi:hypothetical protein
MRHPPGFIEPCLPTVSRTVPIGPQWVFEIKHEGFRFICRREGERVRGTPHNSLILLRSSKISALPAIETYFWPLVSEKADGVRLPRQRRGRSLCSK